MYVLGLDVSTKTGWAILDSKSNLVDYGLIKLKSKDLKERLDCLNLEIGKILSKHTINTVVIEAVYHGPNPKTTALLNKLQGSVVSTLPSNISIKFTNATRARKEVLGKGKSYKKQDVYDWAIKKYKLKNFSFSTSNDITDAILLASYGLI